MNGGIKKHKLMNIVARIILHTILIIGGLMMILPFIWMIVSSFKTPLEVISIPFRFFPSTWTLENYVKVFDELPMIRGYLNSLIVSTGITTLVIFTSTSAGYLFAKLRFRGREILFIVVLTSIMIPPQIVLIPLYYMFIRFGLINSYLGLIVPFAMSAFGIFLMRQFIYGIPNALIDAAKIDGASDFKIYLRIILPLTKPAFSVLGILTFIWSWDEFLWPLIMINQEEMKTLPVILGHFTMSEGKFPGAAMASVSLVVMPVIIVYLFFQRFFIKGLSMTGMKG